MKKLVLGVMLAITLFMPIKANAEEQVNNYSIVIENIETDLGIEYKPNIHYYNDPYGYISYLQTNGENTIPNLYINVARTESETTLIYAIAHELRHQWQFEEMVRQTEMGKALYNNYCNYVNPINTIAYRNQLLESDADNYAYNYCVSLGLTDINIY